MTLQEIERLSKDFADCRDMLVERVTNLNDEIERSKRRLMPGIRSAVRALAGHKAALQAAIEDNRELFKRPKTQVLHGVRVGLRKGSISLSWPDTEKLLAAIKRVFPESADTLIVSKESPVRANLERMSAGDLKRIGVHVSGGDDQVVIQPTDSDVDKVVNALIKEACKGEDAASQAA
jgi:hypothetical protein